MSRNLIRVQSLLGLVPLSAYLALHVFDHWPAVRNREVWVDHAVRHLPRTWLACLALLALSAHAALGWMRMRREPSDGAHQRGMRLVQGVTGGLVLAFILYHGSQMWAIDAGPHMSMRDTYAALWQTAGRPLNLAVYLFGISATCFHFGHGLSRAGATWGLATTPRAVLWWRMGAGALGLLLWWMLLELLSHFALGASLIPG